MHDPDQWQLFCQQLLLEFDPRKSRKDSPACHCAHYLHTQATNPSPTIVTPKE
jgi:hypothetical protein